MLRADLHICKMCLEFRISIMVVQSHQSQMCLRKQEVVPTRCMKRVGVYVRSLEVVLRKHLFYPALYMKIIGEATPKVLMQPCQVFHEFRVSNSLAECV